MTPDEIAILAFFALIAAIVWGVALRERYRAQTVRDPEAELGPFEVVDPPITIAELTTIRLGLRARDGALIVFRVPLRHADALADHLRNAISDALKETAPLRSPAKE